MTQAATAVAAKPNVGSACRALGYDRRSQLAGLAVAIALPLAGVVAAWSRVGFVGLALAVIVPGPAILALAALRHRSRWPAEEVFIWQNLASDADWRRATGGSWPKTAEGALRWLARFPEGSVPAQYRVTALLTAGMEAEARAAAAVMPATSPREAHLKLDVALAFELRDGSSVEETAVAADKAAREDPETPAEVLAVHLARHASIVAQSHGLDGLAELAAARSSLGRLRGKWARAVWRSRFRFALASLVVGVWIVVAIQLSGATAGGAFWL